jgi:hypothetical protein
VSNDVTYCFRIVHMQHSYVTAVDLQVHLFMYSTLHTHVCRVAMYCMRFSLLFSFPASVHYVAAQPTTGSTCSGCGDAGASLSLPQ